MSVKIKYKGTEIASASTEVTKTIKTAGKYCEADILVENTPDGGDAPVINPLSVTANGTYTAPSGVDGYSPVTVNVSGGSLPSSISKIDGGSFTVATTTVTSEFPISHTLGEEPKGFMVWSEPLIGGSNSMNCTIATNYSIATTDLSNVKAAGGLLYSKGWAGYSSYNYLFDAKPDLFGADYIAVANVGANYLASCTYKWLAWA